MQDTALAIHVTTPTYPVPRVIGFQTSHRKLHEIFSLILASKRLISQEAIDNFCCNLTWVLLIVLSQLRINPINTVNKQLVKTFILIAMAGPDFTTSLISPST